MAGNYIVSARKYRPDTFGSIVGQEATAATLRTAVLAGRVAHAYLFCGPRGVGKTTAARVLAKTINCTQLSAEGEACGVCESCRAFEQQRSFNIFELDAASNNSVEDIRTLTEQVAMPPALGCYKVYIIDEVHMLSQAAFNAFLKTLEEPPSYAIFILATTEKHKILPTILSRCQIYDFRRITVLDIMRHLGYVAASEGIQAEEAALGLIAEKADGGMRDALSMFDRIASFSGRQITYSAALTCLNVLDHTAYLRLIEALIGGDYRSLMVILDELLARGFDGQIILAGLASFMRDLLVAQHSDTLHLLEKPQSVAQLYAQTAQRVSASSLHQAIKILVQADQQYRSATSKRLLVELSLLNLIAPFRTTESSNTAAARPQQAQPTAAAAASTARGAQATGPTTAPRPQPSSAPTTQPHPVQPSAPPVAPTPQPQPQVTSPTPRPESPQPSVTMPQTTAASVEPSSEPMAKASQPTPELTTPMEEELRQGRQRFRGLKARSQRMGTAIEQAEQEQPIEARESFDEVALQRAWVQFIDQELEEEKVICRNIMQQELPRLISPEIAEVTIIDSAAVMAPIEQELTRIQAYLRRTLRHGGLELKLRAKTESEQTFVPVTAQERYEYLAEINPALRKLRETLKLRML